jgi:hypothetical protein
MKIALCICGLTNDYARGFEILNDLVLSKYNIDTYLHAWETNTEVIKDIINKYKPINYKFEPQKNFSEELSRFDVSKLEAGGTSLFKLFSYTYSRKKCFDLIQEKYDCVIICRFDVFNWHGIYNAPQDHLCVLNLVKDIDTNLIYCKTWNQLNSGMAEHWFYSSYENIKIICKLYDDLFEYLVDGSDFLNKLFVTGWPISNASNEFSNEILKPINERSTDLLIGNILCVLNHHYIYKYHLYKNNLLEKCKFIL